MLRMMKDHLASWRHSADSATNAHGSKVIGGRIRDVRFAKKHETARARGKIMKALSALVAGT